MTQALAYSFFHSLTFAPSPWRPDLGNCVWTFGLLQSCHPSRSRQPTELLTCVPGNNWNKELARGCTTRLEFPSASWRLWHLCFFSWCFQLLRLLSKPGKQRLSWGGGWANPSGVEQMKECGEMSQRDTSFELISISMCPLALLLFFFLEFVLWGNGLLISPIWTEHCFIHRGLVGYIYQCGL